VTRDAPCPGSTLGTVELDLPDDAEGFLPFAFSCEDVDRHVEEDFARKQKGATAIPIGTYAVRLYDSPKHGPDTLELVDVPGFQHIQIHSGNDASDTDGCLLFGLGRDLGAGKVTRSRPACAWLRAEAIKVLQAGGTVSVEVRRA
jgi:hypothetical protein